MEKQGGVATRGGGKRKGELNIFAGPGIRMGKGAGSLVYYRYTTWSLPHTFIAYLDSATSSVLIEVVRNDDRMMRWSVAGKKNRGKELEDGLVCLGF